MDIAAHMDLIKSNCTIHPMADVFLFEHKRAVSRVFRDIIGHCEVNHLSIALINDQNEIIFLSYTPSMEYNLIQSGLWAYDGTYHPDFYKASSCKHWDGLYHSNRYHDLVHLKQIRTGFKAGVSISTEIDNLFIVYSFATKSNTASAATQLLYKRVRLTQMGWYCLQKLSKFISPYIIPEIKNGNNQRPSHIKLIVNNQVHHE